ncbi:type II toxin-antitoxin system Phd/YefM family antitoxin [Devosia nitrariae]|uniref:Antitoxin n=1 Tax=Devosia nitrariae TaxID=2071872 RepID=A0ABQ5W2S9_9HYPH|nr:type II toxin-antitoxin system prevent-host-death family antitoxin [Devosia nitrariae]GLQ54119.1 antitoxin [Devosia nitrariae]
MQISVTAAKAQLTELVRRAEAGEDVVLTRHGQPVLRFVPVKPVPTAEEKRAAIDRILAKAAKRPKSDVSAARSQDFLYNENGLPE